MAKRRLSRPARKRRVEAPDTAPQAQETTHALSEALHARVEAFIAVLTIPRMAVLCLGVVLVMIPASIYRHRAAWLRHEIQGAIERQDWQGLLRHRRAMLSTQSASDMDRIRLGEACVLAGRPEEALQSLEPLTERFDRESGDVHPRHLAYYASVKAWALIESGGVDEARKYVDRARRLSPEAASTRAVAALLQVTEGQPLLAAPLVQGIEDRPRYSPILAEYRQALESSILSVPQEALADVPEKGPSISLVPEAQIPTGIRGPVRRIAPSRPKP